MAVYLTPDSSYSANGLKVNYYNILNHNVNKISMPSKRTKKLYGITIHNTDWINVNPATTPAEQYTRACINGNLNTVRVHYYVDDICAWQNLPDEWQSWHAADGNGNGNTATISIECIMRNQSDSVSQASMYNCAKLTAYLLKKYGLTVNDVYTHTYWLNVRDGKGVNLSKDERCCLKHSYKVCPLFIIPQWNKFISLVNQYLKAMDGMVVESTPTKPTTSTTSKDYLYRVRVEDLDLNVREGAGVNNPIVTVVHKGDVFTIVQEKKIGLSTWGLLKSYADKRNGWINVSKPYCTKL